MFAIPKPLSFRSPEYQLLLQHLREARQRSGLTQEEVARRMGKPQSFVSKTFSAERRLDAIELLDFCDAVGESPAHFMQQLATAVKKSRLKNPDNSSPQEKTDRRRVR